MLSDERAIVRFDLPRRHQTTSGDGGDLGGMRFRVAVSQKAERSGSTRAMAHSAPVREKRGDLLRVGDRRSRSGTRPECDEGDQAGGAVPTFRPATVKSATAFRCV